MTRPRAAEMVKPSDISHDEWLFRLTTERNDLMRQLRKSVHTRGNTMQSYFNRLDRAIAKAKASVERQLSNLS